MSHRYYRPAEAAEYLGVSAKTLANWRSKGVGPNSLRMHRMVRYDELDLDTWIRKGRRERAQRTGV